MTAEDVCGLICKHTYMSTLTVATAVSLGAFIYIYLGLPTTPQQSITAQSVFSELNIYG